MFPAEPQPPSEPTKELKNSDGDHKQVFRSTFIESIPEEVTQELIEISNFHIMNAPSNVSDDVFASATTVFIKPREYLNMSSRPMKLCGDIRGYPVTTLFDTGADKTFILDNVAEELQLQYTKSCYLKIRMAAKDISLVSKIYTGTIITRGGGEVNFTAYGCPDLGHINIPSENTIKKLDTLLPPAISICDLGLPEVNKSELIIGLDLVPYMMEGIPHLNNLNIKGLKF